MRGFKNFPKAITPKANEIMQLELEPLYSNFIAQLNGFKYCYTLLTVQLNLIYLFTQFYFYDSIYHKLFVFLV